MIDRETMLYMLRQWGRWQRTAKNPSQDYVLSQHDNPLQKKRDVKPIYYDETSQKLDQLMLEYLPKEYIKVLTLSYVESTNNISAADELGISVKSYTIKRNEAVSMLRGVYNVINQKFPLNA